MSISEELVAKQFSTETPLIAISEEKDLEKYARDVISKTCNQFRNNELGDWNLWAYVTHAYLAWTRGEYFPLPPYDWDNSIILGLTEQEDELLDELVKSSVISELMIAIFSKKEHDPGKFLGEAKAIIQQVMD